MKKLFLLGLIAVSTFLTAQKMKVTSGSFAALKGITLYDVTFDYSNLKVDKFKTEEDFLKDKMKKREEKGTDDDFKKSWFADREDRYEPKFIESFNKREPSIQVGKNNGAPYVMTVKTTWIYPGYNVGAWRQDSKINTTITISDKANPDKILLTVDYSDVPGGGAFGNDYNSGYRISESYAKLAKELAADIKKGKK
ncbi:hypothetical protein ACFO4P_06060 [Epilithonimonas pallida]|uniref:DUF4136 domain-containing protein n=1 Tax=Epilithonimonas pallida TaxID=373671 RepID=A0ABY1R869_9FLAO|nr:hypothetical protein [Epilithonimonas pallida]SMP96423.1 hypothetical protein SAMN05421679_10927 [Epilithonimonas pallida]